MADKLVFTLSVDNTTSLYSLAIANAGVAPECPYDMGHAEGENLLELLADASRQIAGARLAPGQRDPMAPKRLEVCRKQLLAWANKKFLAGPLEMEPAGPIRDNLDVCPCCEKPRKNYTWLHHLTGGFIYVKGFEEAGHWDTQGFFHLGSHCAKKELADTRQRFRAAALDGIAYPGDDAQ